MISSLHLSNVDWKKIFQLGNDNPHLVAIRERHVTTKAAISGVSFNI